MYLLINNKKRSLFVCLFFLLISQINCAQGLTSIGIKAGATSTRFVWNVQPNKSVPEQQVSLQRATGLFIDVPLGLVDKQYWAVDANLAFMEKKGIDEYIYYEGFAADEKKDVYRLQNLSLLLAFQAKWPIGNFTPYLTMGPRIDYSIGRSDNFDYFNVKGESILIANGLYPENYYYGTQDMHNRWVYGITYGLGVSYNFEKTKIFLEATRNTNFNHLSQIQGRTDGYGTEEYRLSLRERTYMANIGLNYLL